MKRARTLPYRRADDETVQASSWHLGEAGSGKELTDHIPGWDVKLSIQLAQRLRIDAGALRSQTGMPPHATLKLLVRWLCSSTRRRGVQTIATLPPDGIVEREIHLQLRGADLGGTLELATVVMLSAALPRAPIRAWMPGTVLWDSVNELRLEGSGSRFPMTAVPFSKAHYSLPNHAAWHLDFDDDLSLPVLGSVMLYINEENPTVKQMLSDPDAPAAQTASAVLQFDVAAQLVRAAIASESFRNRQNPWPRDSLGMVMERLLKTRFRRDEHEAMRQDMVERPGQFASMLQDRLRFLAGVEL